MQTLIKEIITKEQFCSVPRHHGRPYPQACLLCCAQTSGCSGSPPPGGKQLLTGEKGAAGAPGLTRAPGPAGRSPRTHLPTRTRHQRSSLRLTHSCKASNTPLPSQLAEPRSSWLCRRSGLQTMRKAPPRSSRKWKGTIKPWQFSPEPRHFSSWEQRIKSVESQATGGSYDPGKTDTRKKKPLRGNALKIDTKSSE